MNPVELKPKDLKSDQEVRWCPGCGDYSILNSAQAVLAELGIPREKMCMISGIGCSSRFPYYMNTYGFHSIHGRALAIATGTKTANPELSVWVATGDGDCMSIGGNHFIHTLRRNVDLKILMFNNRIYGLTKGQYSPTSEPGKITKSTPVGSVDRPFNPVSLALGAEATFVARTIDSDRSHLIEVLRAAAEHQGTALVEIYQNCNIFNDGAFDLVKNPESRDEALIRLVPGEPIVFGDRRVVRDASGHLQVATEGEAVVHDPTDLELAFALSRLSGSELDHTPIGIFRQVSAPTYDAEVRAQVEGGASDADLQSLLTGPDPWAVN